MRHLTDELAETNLKLAKNLETSINIIEESTYLPLTSEFNDDEKVNLRLKLAREQQQALWDNQVKRIFSIRDADNFKRRHKTQDRPTTLIDM